MAKNVYFPPTWKVSKSGIHQSIKFNEEDYSLRAGNQITDSENHVRGRDGRYHEGGPFYTSRIDYGGVNPTVSLRVSNSEGNYQYDGPVTLRPLPSQLNEWFGENTEMKHRSEDTSDLDPDGAVAISLVSPANPNTNLATTVAESVKEGIPSLPGIQSWKQRTNVAKAAGSEFLNAEFGWLPLVDEVNEVVKAARFHKLILNQYHRDEGRNVRRDFDFDIEHSSKAMKEGVTLKPRIYASSGTFFNVALGTWDTSGVRTRTTRKWFVGSFTYGTAHQSDSWRRALGFGTDADALYGIALSPDILWELTPWSWAIDWFTNAGMVVNNLTNFALAGQIMRYGYMMEESIDNITVTATSRGDNQVKRGRVATYEANSVSKVRRPANPFGFGLTGADLSPTQALIAAAVGISLL